MGDVQLVTTRISKTSLTQGQGSPSQDPPAFTLPPRNARVSPGGTARLDGKVWISLSLHFPLSKSLSFLLTLYWLYLFLFNPPQHV